MITGKWFTCQFHNCVVFLQLYLDFTSAASTKNNWVADKNQLNVTLSDFVRPLAGNMVTVKKLIKFKVKQPLLLRTKIILHSMFSIIINNECYFISMSAYSDNKTTEINKLPFQNCIFWVDMTKSVAFLGPSLHCLSVHRHLNPGKADLMKDFILCWFWMKTLWFSI